MRFLLPALLATVLFACTSDAPMPAMTANPLLAEWTGPYGGVPPFDQVKPEYFRPALEEAMTMATTAIDSIAANPEPASFENTIAALEGSRRTLNRVELIFDVWTSNMNTGDIPAIERDMAPRLAAFNDTVHQNKTLFERIAAVYQGPQYATLNPEQQRLTWLYYTEFVRSGAALDEAQKTRTAQINRRLAELFATFSQNLLADESGHTVVLETEDDLAGLPQSIIDAAAAAASAAGQDGKWVIANTRSSAEPFLTYSARRDLRERVWRMFVSRGDNGDDHDNKAILSEIVQLRAERASLLGYETFADWKLETAMAKTPQRAMELMQRVWTPAVRAAAAEVDGMKTFAEADGIDRVEPWDYRYYAEKVRLALYDLDENELKPYLQLDKLREAMIWVSGELYDLEFTPVDDVPVFQEDVHVWKVTNRKTAAFVGLWYLDPYARAGKRSGAWMNAYRNQERYAGDVRTIVSNNSNFVKGRPGQPVLISWTDATTLFHEFGHALHGLLSSVEYPKLSGTDVARDYVEFPSQLLEHWLSTPEVLSRFAVHFETGEPIPQELVDRVYRASTFKQGFDTVEYLGSAIVDMKLHSLPLSAQPVDPASFEMETLAEIGMPREIVMRHRLPQFSHLFSSDGYAAGYYSYLWSDVLTADAWEAFTDEGGAYDLAVADRLRDSVLSRGNTIDPADAYRAFRGRDPEVDALMRDRGFVQ